MVNEEIKIILKSIGLNLESFVQKKDILTKNKIKSIYDEMQKSKNRINESGLKDNLLLDKLEYKSKVFGDRAKNILLTQKEELIIKTIKIKLYKKEMLLVEENNKINVELNAQIEELNKELMKRTNESLKGLKKEINHYFLKREYLFLFLAIAIVIAI